MTGSHNTAPTLTLDDSLPPAGTVDVAAWLRAQSARFDAELAAVEAYRARNRGGPLAEPEQKS